MCLASETVYISAIKSPGHPQVLESCCQYLLDWGLWNHLINKLLAAIKTHCWAESVLVLTFELIEYRSSSSITWLDWKSISFVHLVSSIDQARDTRSQVFNQIKMYLSGPSRYLLTWLTFPKKLFGFVLRFPKIIRSFLAFAINWMAQTARAFGC